MTTLTLYAIKHKPTGRYLPRAGGRDGRGGSHMEPVDPSPTSPPRMFHNEHAAKAALGQWLLGVFERDVRQSSDWDGDFEETIRVKHQPHRKRENMEIVAVEVRL